MATTSSRPTWPEILCRGTGGLLRLFHYIVDALTGGRIRRNRGTAARTGTIEQDCGRRKSHEKGDGLLVVGEAGKACNRTAVIEGVFHDISRGPRLLLRQLLVRVVQGQVFARERFLRLEVDGDGSEVLVEHDAALEQGRVHHVFDFQAARVGIFSRNLQIGDAC
jgi:hypothetical protein